MAPHSQRGRSGWIGGAFLALSLLIGFGTLFLALTDRSLADLTDMDALFSGDDSNSSNDVAQSLTPAVTATPTEVPPDPIPADLELSARAAYVIHTDSGTVLFERDGDQPLQPASTAKIFTALVVLEYASPEEVIEIQESDVVDPVVESSMNLEPGDRVTVHDLLVGLMLPSGNDAANALSRTIGARIEGDDDESYGERFIREMNRVAQDLGLGSTNLRHAAGHDRDDQVVTATELSVAAAALLESPSLTAIVAMPRAEVRVGGENPRVLTVDNTNELLVHDGIYGIKTGTTTEAGQCLVVAYRNGEETMIAVILGSEDRYTDARTLLDLPDPPEPADDDAEEYSPEHTAPVEEPADPDG